MTTAEPEGKPKRVSIGVKLFVLFHLFVITSWTIPQPTPGIANGTIAPGGTEWLIYWNDKYIKPFPPTSAYAKVTGFWQYWDMFAPNPTHVDEWGDADVVYRDGTVKRYDYPRMSQLSIWERFLKERYRKFYERIDTEDYLYLWPSFCLRIALLNDDLKNPPVSVKLYTHRRPVAAPGTVQLLAYSKEILYTYIVDEKELARLRKLGQ